MTQAKPAYPQVRLQRIPHTTETKRSYTAKGVASSGAGGGGRTRTVLLPTDFESVTSANSITPALLLLKQRILVYHKRRKTSSKIDFF